MSRAPSLYNQTTLNEDDFVANFVARHVVLDALLRRLQATGPQDGGMHHILIGPRGMGKTSMLRRLGIGISRNPELAARFIPLNFREEQYNVLKLGDFWRNCGEALAEWADANEMADLADHMDAAISSAAWADDDGATRGFQEELHRLGRRAVLFIDNIDIILDNLSDEDNWKLRHSLQAPEGPIVIGAATHLLPQTSNRAHAFYEFFQSHHLDPLDATETEACMRALAARRGENGAHVLEVLDRQPERLKTLHVLTGGNPRILALIYRLLETAESDAAMADLETLLDQVTPYYKARIEE
ncbi:MAG: ATP-binding protein, partial [Rhizobiaceae bacterium]